MSIININALFAKLYALRIIAAALLAGELFIQ